VAAKSDTLLVSRRLDSRTFFVQDVRYGPGKEGGVFQGSDDELRNIGNGLLVRLGIPDREVLDAVVLRETTQVGSVDPKSGEVIREDPQAGRRLVRFNRQIEGVPVFSSGLTLGLTKDKTIGFMELALAGNSRISHHRGSPTELQAQKGLATAGAERREGGVQRGPALFTRPQPGFLMDIYPRHQGRLCA